MPAQAPARVSSMRPRIQVALGLALCIGLFVLWVLSPVCVPIPDDDLLLFEESHSLEERAARGEPFEQKDGRWYQCKLRLARAFF
jgi:hypothetical protein